MIKHAKAITKNSFTTKVKIRNHEIITDEPIELNGNNEGPTPMELISAALASCTSITLRMYVNRKEWEVNEITVDVKHEVTEQGHVFEKQISIQGNLDEKQMERVYKVAEKCPVNKLLAQAALMKVNM